MRIQLQCIQIQVQVLPAASDSVFPRLEAILKKRPAENAMKWIFGKIDDSKFRDRIDQFLCKVFPDREWECMRFYKGFGPQLKDIESEEILLEVEDTLLFAFSVLQEAYKGRREHECQEWQIIRQLILHLLG